ncbi:MAG: hypothetical protein WD602_01730 [Actinomycetota bacterium]
MNSCAGRSSRARFRALALGAAVTLVAAACAQATQSGGSGPASGVDPVSQAEPGGNVLPEVAVLDVDTGDTVNLGSLVPAPRPILLWFWAPH